MQQGEGDGNGAGLAPCHCMVVTAAWDTGLKSDRCLERVRDRSAAYFVELKNEEMKEANIKNLGRPVGCGVSTLGPVRLFEE